MSINLRRNIEMAIKEANEIIHNSPTFKNSSFNIQKFDTEITGINKLIERNSYFDGLDAQPKAKSLVEKGKDYIERAKGYFDGIVNRIESEIRDTVRKDKDETDEKREKLQNPALIFIMIALMLFGGLVLAAFSKSSTLILLCSFVFLFGGWFIAQAILRSLGHLIYTEKDFSQFIAENQRKKSEMKECHNKLTTIIPTGRTWTQPSN